MMDALFTPYQSMDSMDIGVVIGGCICLYLSCVMGSAGGIGGGGLNVPILLVILGFKFKQATILSLCTVLGNYLSQIYLNWNRSHPLMGSRPLIYFELIIVLVPAQLGGNNIGVIIREIFPESILLILAIVVVVYAQVKTSFKALKLYNKETKLLTGDESLKRAFMVTSSGQRLAIDDEDDMDDDELDNPLLLDNNHSLHSSSAIESGSIPADDSLKLDKYLTKSYTPVATNFVASKNPAGSNSGIRLFDYSRDSFSSSIPTIIRDHYILAALFAVWAAYGAFYITLQVAAKICSGEYFLLLSLSFLPLIVTILFGLRYVRANQIEDAHLILEGDVDFTKLSIVPAVLSFIIGILCSLLGIGGGELMGPLLLSLHVLPLVSSATTSFMSFMSSSSNILHYAIEGDIDYRWAAVCFSIGLLGGTTGRSLALYLVAKYKRASLTAIALAFILAISVLLLVYDIVSSDFDLSMHNFCKS